MIAFLKYLSKLLHSKINTLDMKVENEVLRETFLKSFSHSPHNQECIDQIEFGESKNREHGPSSVWGLKIKDKNYLLSDILWKLEDDEVYQIIGKKFPDLKDEEIEAVLRLATTLMTSVELEFREIKNS